MTSCAPSSRDPATSEVADPCGADPCRRGRTRQESCVGDCARFRASYGQEPLRSRLSGAEIDGLWWVHWYATGFPGLAAAVHGAGRFRAHEAVRDLTRRSKIGLDRDVDRAFQPDARDRPSPVFFAHVFRGVDAATDASIRRRDTIDRALQPLLRRGEPPAVGLPPSKWSEPMLWF